MKSPRFAPLALGSLLFACSVPADANPSVRCDAQGLCPQGAVCYAGFCIAEDEAEGAPYDAGAGFSRTDANASFPAADASAAADAGIAAPPDDRSADDGAAVPPDDEGKQGEQAESPSCARCCTPGVNVCVDLCVDLFSSIEHCGECGRFCNAGEVCLQGECCASDEILCDGRCVNPTSDKKHCGGCGQSCDRGPCKEGMCRRDP